MAFNYIDYIFLAFILFSSLLGLARGFWLQLITLGIWLIAIISYSLVGANFSAYLISKGLATDTANWLIIGVFVIIFFCIGFVARFFASNLLGVNTFSFFNKLLGLLLGFFIALIALAILIYGVNQLDYHRQKDWQHAVIVAKFSHVTDQLIGTFHARHHHAITNADSALSANEYAKELA